MEDWYSMASFIEENGNIPVVSESDVLVIGGGLAGVSAAVSAARLGKKVTLIEKSIVLGGLATLGHVCIYLAICDGLGTKVFGGMAEELLQLSIKYSYNNLPDERWTMGVKHIDNPKGRYRTTFNIPAYVLALDELGRHAEALDSFDHAGELAPNAPQIWSARARALEQLGRQAEADESRRRAADLEAAQTAERESPTPTSEEDDE
jgi:glycine/D-amino acid oxidase-like deaminating enzyme